jgi:hypothetical protein
MKGYMILGSLLAVLVTPVQAQQGPPGSVNINGNIFDAPQAYQAGPAPGYEAQPATRARPARHVRKHHRVHSPT